ncbi:RsmE family RNA methyltransferase [bacterium]|nr:RsmE family RNA methyltransferase [bacterium]
MGILPGRALGLHVSGETNFMRPRFWIEPALTSGLHLLPETEAHHARHVLRLAVGDPIEVFDGRGASAEALIAACDKKRVQIDVGTVSTTPEPATRLTIATAVPKGERMDWLVEKATELGVSRLIPLRTSRSSVDPRDSKLDRLRMQVIAACKQSRRNHLMELEPVVDFAEFLRSQTQPWFIAHPGGQPLAGVLCDHVPHPQPELVMAIGPEGGWTDEEITLAEAAQARRIALGSTILRVETAVLAVAAVVSALGYRSHQDIGGGGQSE